MEAAAIAGGQESAPGDAPWTAALIDTSQTPSQECLDSGGSEDFCQQYCGGVLIAPDWALTAAHCLAERNVADIRLLLGHPDLNGSSYETFTIQDYDSPANIQDLRNEVTYQQDIVLLQLDRSTSISPASLASSTRLKNLEGNANTLPDPVSIFGWGQLHDNGAFPAVLRQVNYNLRPPSLYPNDCGTNDFFIEDTMICASEPDAATIEPDDTGDSTPRDPYGEGSCEKDSGGPMVDLDSGSPFVVGLASWGLNGNCGDPEYPDVFTRVPYYLNDIENFSANMAGPDLFNAAVTITGPTAVNTDSTTITVTLENRGQVNAVPNAEFTLDWTGTGSVGSPTSLTNLTCSGSGPVTCTHDSTSMSAGGSASADFPVSGLSSNGDSTLTLNANANWSSGQDYQSATGTDQHRIAYTNKPDLRLDVEGVVPETLQDGGQLWVYGKVRNASDQGVDASNVRLIIEPPSDHVLADWPDSLPSCSTATASPYCEIAATLSAGSAVSFGPLRLDSAAREDGTLKLSVTADEGDFPTTDSDGNPDTEASASITYPEPPSTSDSGSDSGSLPGGGIVPQALFLLALLGFVRRLRRF